MWMWMLPDGQDSYHLEWCTCRAPSALHNVAMQAVSDPRLVHCWNVWYRHTHTSTLTFVYVHSQRLHVSANHVAIIRDVKYKVQIRYKNQIKL
jgi:hypothetical protein